MEKEKNLYINVCTLQKKEEEEEKLALIELYSDKRQMFNIVLLFS